MGDDDCKIINRAEHFLTAYVPTFTPLVYLMLISGLRVGACDLTTMVSFSVNASSFLGTHFIGILLPGDLPFRVVLVVWNKRLHSTAACGYAYFVNLDLDLIVCVK